ncbi:hypothetical protein Taro_042383, partial [Colocasia esculenta]|nr:hypothetical protein [Colocasia esculenta]
LLRDALDSISQGEPVAHEPSIAKSVAEVHTEDVVMEEAPSQQEQVQVQEDVVMDDAPIEGKQSVTEKFQGVSAVASGHTEIHSEVLLVQEEEAAVAAQTEVPMESVHAEGEAEVEKGSETQGEGNEIPPENQFREGKTASSSDSEDDQDQQPPMDNAQKKGKAIEVPDVPLLADTPYERQMRQRVIINLKPVIERLDAQGEILCSLQSDVNSIFMSQASVTKVIYQVRNDMKWFNKEMGSMKSMLSEILKVVGAQSTPPPPPAAQRSEEVPPSPPSSSTAPPAPHTFKKPQPRTISSPTPFPSQSTSSPASSTPISPPPPVFEVPPGSSSAGATSSSGPPSSGPSDIPPTTSHSLSHPSPPLSFITIIPEGAQLESPYLGKVKDKFEEDILRSVLKVGDHIHRADSSSSAPKKRKFSSLSSEPRYPPLWFSLTGDNRNKPLYREYHQKVVFATHINLHFLNLSNHLNIILPYTSLTKLEKSEIFSIAHSNTKEQWARGHRELYNKFLLARSARFPPRDHSLTLSEWFQIHHNNCWAPFIQKEIKMARHFQLFNNYRYVHRLLEVQFSQFKQAINALGLADTHTEAVQVDFATLQVPEEILLLPIHSLVMDSSVGSIIFERFARVMGRIKVQKGFQVAFHRFLFREYHQGHVSAEVLAPILSECERLTPSDWASFYPLSAQQLLEHNESQAREGHSPISTATFLDMNSIHLVQDPFQIWVEHYKVYVALCQELKAKHNLYPISVDQFLTRASFGSVSFKRISLSREAYANLLDEKLALHLKRMAPSIGPKYTLAPGVFRQVFEKQEE